MLGSDAETQEEMDAEVGLICVARVGRRLGPRLHWSRIASASGLRAEMIRGSFVTRTARLWENCTMSFTSWIRGFRKPGGARTSRIRRRVSCRLLLEPLEVRFAPASLVPLASFFDGNNGHGPNGGLVADGSGNLFGTANSGGAYGRGTVVDDVKAT